MTRDEFDVLQKRIRIDKEGYSDAVIVHEIEIKECQDRISKLQGWVAGLKKQVIGCNERLMIKWR